MSVYETSFLQDEDNICRSMLNLSTASDHDHHPVAPHPAVCVCSAKRQSPLSRSLLQEPAPKRATLHPTAAEDPDLLGYKKLPLPPYFLSAPPPPLRRTLSEPIYSPATVPTPQLPGFPTSPPPIKTQQRQEICNGNIGQESYPLPETSPLLYRTVSDPNPASNRQVVAAAGTPPRPPARRKSPSFGESPNARRLRRMKERLKQMSQWANQVSSADDGEEDTVQSDNRCLDNDHKEECDENLPQEAVFVEKSGECLVLHFKCPCGDGYQILLSGNNCYYKLTNFRNS